AAYTVTHKATSASPIDAKRAGRKPESIAVIVKKSSTAETAENAWFDKLTMSVHPAPVEGCVLRGKTSCLFKRSSALHLRGTRGRACASPSGPRHTCWSSSARD